MVYNKSILLYLNFYNNILQFVLFIYKEFIFIMYFLIQCFVFFTLNIKLIIFKLLLFNNNSCIYIIFSYIY